MMTFLAHEHIFDATENWGGVAGGDNRAESRLGQIKATMRRCGTLKGHYSSKYKRIQVLAAAALHRKPGII